MKISLIDGFTKKINRFKKKHPKEVEAILKNLGRYNKAIDGLKDYKEFRARYVHPERGGVIAIGQAPADKKLGKLKESRLYIYVKIKDNTIYLLNIGDKQNQDKDVQESFKMIKNFKK